MAWQISIDQIKRIAVQRRKFVEIENGSFIKWKHRNPMSFSLLHHKTFNRIG